MRKFTLTEPASQTTTLPELRVAAINRSQHQQPASTEKHFTRTVNGDPGINTPAQTYYSRAYSPDGPGGNYQGL